MELGLTTPVAKMRLIDALPLHNHFDITDARLITPHAPSVRCSTDGSQLRGNGQMPPLVSSEVDHKAVELIAEWIRSLPPAGQ